MPKKRRMSVEGLRGILSRFSEFDSSSANLNPASRGRAKREVSIGDAQVLFYVDSEGTVEDICVRGSGDYSFIGEPVWSAVAERVATRFDVNFGRSEYYSHPSDPNCYFVSPRTRIEKRDDPKYSGGLKDGANLVQEIRRVIDAQSKFNKIILAEVDRIAH